MMYKYDVFISYSWNDIDTAKYIYDKIVKAGLTCCFDKETFHGGVDFPMITADNICNSDIFLYLGSKSSFTSGWAPDEVAFAKSHKLRGKLLYYGIDNSQMPIWMELAFAAVNRRNIIEHPVDTVLIQDIKTLLKGQQIANIEPDIVITEAIYSVNIGDCTLDMIRVEGGSIFAGATEEQLQFADKAEIPAHEINVSTFYISKYPITQDLWELVMSYNKSRFQKLDCDGHNLYSRYPAETLDYTSAQHFVKKLSKMTQLPFSIPTEEEWEYAARGGQKSNGYIYAGSDNIDEVAWYKFNSDGYTHPVGEKKPNELGIYDMSGNVWEWTESHMHWYSEPDVESEDSVFVRRGGSWWHDASNCRVSKRYASDKSKKTSGLGLRVVIRIK